MCGRVLPSSISSSQREQNGKEVEDAISSVTSHTEEAEMNPPRFVKRIHLTFTHLYPESSNNPTSTFLGFLAFLGPTLFTFDFHIQLSLRVHLRTSKCIPCGLHPCCPFIVILLLFLQTCDFCRLKCFIMTVNICHLSVLRCMQLACDFGEHQSR